MGSVKDRNGLDLTEAEDSKKRWQKYTELYKKDLHDPDNHDGVITHLESDTTEQLPLCKKYSLSISNFIEEISSLSHSIVFLCFFALIT